MNRANQLCPRDDGAKWGGFNAHLRRLWTAADTETQNDFLEAIKQGHREVKIRYVENVKRSRSEKAGEHSSKGEKAGDDASPATPNGNRDKDPGFERILLPFPVLPSNSFFIYLCSATDVMII